jgi:hypothetical protein
MKKRIQVVVVAYTIILQESLQTQKIADYMIMEYKQPNA